MKQLVLLTLIASCLAACSPRLKQDAELDFGSGEHIVLGELGYRQACESRQSCSSELIRADGQMQYTYGEMVAFSGDFYQEPKDFYFEQVEPFLKWHRNSPENLKGLFQKEVETIENFLHGHSDAHYPDFNIQYAWNYPDYLSIALANKTHFGFYNMIAYVKYHSEALNLALRAHELAARNDERAQEILTYALFVNSFADHFLTDGFASGHVRTPRVQLLEWSKTQNLSERTAGTLAKIIHDRDGEMRASGEHGLQVSNARGDQWLTRCDSQLFWENNMRDPSIQIPVQAVAASVREVLDAYELGTIVEGIYAATEYVAFPSRRERPLTELFAENMPEEKYDAIISQMPFYTRIKAFSGIDKSVLKTFTAALPDIMEMFRRDVKNAIVEFPMLKNHLPRAYLEAYMEVE